MPAGGVRVRVEPRERAERKRNPLDELLETASASDPVQAKERQEA